MFGFKSAKNGLNLEKSSFLLNVVNEGEIDPSLIKRTIQFISFKSDDIPLLNILNFLGGATGLDSILKAYKSSEKNFPLRNISRPWQNVEYKIFLRKTLFTVNFVASEQAVVNLKLIRPTPAGVDN